jgi:hypothetical protein
MVEWGVTFDDSFRIGFGIGRGSHFDGRRSTFVFELKFSWNFQTTFCETPPKG